jgi:hypothetical protein
MDARVTDTELTKNGMNIKRSWANLKKDIITKEIKSSRSEYL